MLALQDRIALLLASAHPLAGLRFARFAGRAASLTSAWGPSPERLAAVFGWMSRRALVRLARWSCEIDFGNHFLFQFVRRFGIESLEGAVRNSGFERVRDLVEQRRPVILLGWHTGYAYAVEAIVARARLPAVVLASKRAYQPPPSMELLATQNAAERAHAFKVALERLNAGGVVLMAGDGGNSSRTGEVTLLERRLSLPRGPYALARLSGAAVIPLSRSWSRGRIHVEFHAPLSYPAPGPTSGLEYEDALALAAIRWLEPRLGSIEQVPRRDLLHFLLSHPLQEASAVNTEAVPL